MMTMMRKHDLLLLLCMVLFAARSSVKVDAQFTCTLSARDEDSCLATDDDDGSACVWCNLSGFGFCLNEASAEIAEQSLPGISCDRKSDSDDQVAPTPTPPTAPSAGPPTKPKPKPPKTDDDIKPTDDKKNVPDNFWNCLKDKDAKTCKADQGCTWCKSKAGYGLCMSGPAAKSAQHSHFYTCDKEFDEEEEEEFIRIANENDDDFDLEDPMDPSCMLAYLKEQSQEACTAATDADGTACEFCTFSGFDLCLTSEQAQIGQQANLGITCQNENDDTIAGEFWNSRNNNGAGDNPINIFNVENMNDPSCITAYLQDPTEEGCTSALDEEGNACEFCSLAGIVNVCLNSDQAEQGEAVGITCQEKPAEDLATLFY